MVDATEAASGTRDDAEVKSQAELVRLWLDALSLADSEEQSWREAAQETINIYRNAKQKLGDILGANDRRFNILHSNVETIVPAIYNSTPIPDVRRRFSDDDKVGKEVADLLERAISYSVDSYDFDDTMRHDIKDMELTGRGLSRVRYKPYFTPGQEEDPNEGVYESGKENGDEGAEQNGETLTYEEVCCEHVPWKHFRHGPARTWDDVPWVAFELFLTREELIKLAPKIGNRVNLDTTLAGSDQKRDGENIKEIFKRARVWEIWDKESRKVYFIAESYKDQPIRVADDPLDLMGFFPIPRPLYAVQTSDSLIPVIPYAIYRDQAEELERVSRRIMALVESIKSRGLYDGSMQELDQLAEADDNTMIAVQNVARFANGGKLEDGIAWWPIDSATKALQQLTEHRDRIKETIYEITGISDILRGETMASETATAQQIKQQWGSLRIQNKQVEVQRYARDLFRLKAEIIANKFQWETIGLMTGLDFPPAQVKQQAQMIAQQAQQTQQPVPPEIGKVLEKPAREEVEQILRNDALRNFRVDVESDSTIRADTTRNQQNMSLFLQGTAQFAQAMGPIVMTFKEMTPVVMEVYSAFARNFKLGKQAEDALDSVADKARQAVAQPKPPETNPEVELKKQELQMKQQELQAKLQAEQQANEQKLQFEAAKFEQEMAFEREKQQAEMQMRAQDLQFRQMEAEQTRQLQAQQHADTVGIEREKLATDSMHREADRNLSAQEGEANRQAQASEGEASRAHDIAKVEAPVMAKKKADVLEKNIENVLKSYQSNMETMMKHLIEEAQAEREAIRGPDGRITGSRRKRREATH